MKNTITGYRIPFEEVKKHLDLYKKGIIKDKIDFQTYFYIMSGGVIDEKNRIDLKKIGVDSVSDFKINISIKEAFELYDEEIKHNYKNIKIQ